MDMGGIIEMTQKDAVLKYIDDFGSISNYEAFKDLGITRLSSVIHDLRKMGYEIETEIEEMTNRYGTKIQYGRYKLNEKVEN